MPADMHEAITEAGKLEDPPSMATYLRKVVRADLKKKGLLK